MSFHTDFDSWQRMSDPRYCPVCNQAPMPEGMVDVVELPNSWLCANQQDCLRGACHLVAKQHVIELFDSKPISPPCELKSTDNRGSGRRLI